MKQTMSAGCTSERDPLVALRDLFERAAGAMSASDFPHWMPDCSHHAARVGWSAALGGSVSGHWACGARGTTPLGACLTREERQTIREKSTNGRGSASPRGPGRPCLPAHSRKR
jgi:hypothetical protein